LDCGIKLEIIWLDNDCIELRVRCGNGRFAATIDCYADREVFSTLAESIRGFPSSSNDRREVELGTFDPNYAGGGARLLLRCADSKGHAVAEVRMRSDPKLSDGRPEMRSSFYLLSQPRSMTL